MRISIEVVYASVDEQLVLPLELDAPATIADAIQLSGMIGRFPEIEPNDDNVGIFGYRYPLSYPLTDGDRVEIYRPLAMSPTEARRLKAASRKKRQGR